MLRRLVALWGGRRPPQIRDTLGVGGWSLDVASRAKIDCILSEAITVPIGPEFMAPRRREPRIGGEFRRAHSDVCIR
jgi:hypothetical protein